MPSISSLVAATSILFGPPHAQCVTHPCRPSARVVSRTKPNKYPSEKRMRAPFYDYAPKGDDRVHAVAPPHEIARGHAPPLIFPPGQGGRATGGAMCACDAVRCGAMRCDAFQHRLCVLASTASRKVGRSFRVGMCLDFVRRSGTTRAEGPHGAHVRGAKRNRIDRR